MKSLPLLSLTLTLACSAAGVWIAARSGLAQDAATTPKPAGPAGPASLSGAAQTDANSPAPSNRRNQRTGAAASLTLEAARDRLYGYSSLKARVVESVAIGPRRFRMTGNYLMGTDLKLRIEYELQVGSTQATLLEVCDGQILWTHHKLGDTERVTRRNVRQITSAAIASGGTSENLLMAELGLGGLPGLMASMQRSVEFESQWEESVGGQTFVVVEGGWKSSYRQKLLGPGAPETQPLPDHVPDLVRIYMEQSSLFPRRVMYLKRDEKGVHRPMVTLDFVEVEWNIPVDDSQFTFTPPEKVQVDDVTQSYISRISGP